MQKKGVMANSDLTFITNEENQTLKDRFRVLIKDAQYFDALVGYFYTSGFSAIYPALENTEKIRILIGISTNRQTFDLISSSQKEEQLEFAFSHGETKKIFETEVAKELEDSEDDESVEKSIATFVSWIKSGKLEIKAYPSQRIHAKLYIMTFKEGDRDQGRVITGSSNLTQSGLVDNLEFNVELKNVSDHKFAKDKFEELWLEAVDVTEKYIETIETKTWLNQDISPYYLYLKFLYEYFKDELGMADDVFADYLPEDFMDLQYQREAVLNAKKILSEYGGVFISDVVGLGKTYIATLLAGQLEGRTLVIAPPALVDKDNPGSWQNAFYDFGIPGSFESVGKLDRVLERGRERYKNVIIDEAHRFRTETNQTYEKIAEICRGKRVILVTATPYNNSPQDILSQLKLFQNARRSTIPNLPDLETFFKELAKKLKDLDRQTDQEEYLRVTRENAREIREKVLKYLMVRRTRAEIEKYFEKDLAEEGLRFPKVAPPESLFYELNEDEDRIFNTTIELLSQDFSYARYTPLLYAKRKLDQLEKQAQRNMGKFMKILLVKRLESSFFAFKKSIQRFIDSYELFIREFNKGNVYISKKHAAKIFELLEKDDDEAIEKLISADKAKRYDSSLFTDSLLENLQSDLAILKRIKELWSTVSRDPKLERLLEALKNNEIPQEGKLILFSESKETVEYLADSIPGKVLAFHGSSGAAGREKVIRNFDAKAKRQKNDYRILIATETLSEGVNLHRANVVINYDIPWNPTRMMQRVGRINRVDTTFDEIHTFNFFPTQQSNDEIKLTEAAIGKINAFLTLLGGDAALLTEGEPVGSHELFRRLSSSKTITGEDDAENSDLKYLIQIKEVRDEDPDLYEKIKYLPRKSRSGKISASAPNALVTYFRKGKLQKFFLSSEDALSAELDFSTAAGLLESDANEKRQRLPATYFSWLDANKDAFVEATTAEEKKTTMRKGRDNTWQMLKLLKAVFKNTQTLTDEQEEYVMQVIASLEAGGLPKETVKNAYKALKAQGNAAANPRTALAVLQMNIREGLLESHYAEQNPRSKGKREVILSMYLAGEE
jgi:superfamily II DNA/RNA helicase/HKD family nuclease